VSICRRIIPEQFLLPDISEAGYSEEKGVWRNFLPGKYSIPPIVLFRPFIKSHGLASSFHIFQATLQFFILIDTFMQILIH